MYLMSKILKALFCPVWKVGLKLQEDSFVSEYLVHLVERKKPFSKPPRRDLVRIQNSGFEAGAIILFELESYAVAGQ